MGKPIILTFGKYKGYRLSDIPRSYLEFLHYKTVGKSMELRKAIAKALDRAPYHTHKQTSTQNDNAIR